MLEADKEGHLCINCKPEWETLIQYQPSPFKILNLHGEKLIYFEKSFHLKNKLEESLNRLIEFKPSSGVNVSKIDDLLTALENKFSQSKDIVFKLNPDQRIAIQNSINSHFQIITGGPGTGKTTVVAFLLQTLLELDLLPNLEEIALVAPTGRAAQRLTESIQSNLNLINENPEFVSSLSGQTLHSLLNY
ncbi:MAG: AAA family ATPase, partial [Nanoarchaeota archaeon]